MKFNLQFILGIAYITIMIGLAWGNVGQMSGPPKPYPWWLPFSMLAICGVPFILGYLAGKNST